VLERVKRAMLDRLGVNRIAAHADHLQARIDTLQSEHSKLERKTDALHSAVALQVTALESRLEHLATWAEIGQATAWASVAPLRHEPLISVVMATRNRSALVKQAVASVVAQTYANWQLVAVDDGSTDDTGRVLADAAQLDDRIVVARTEGVGAGGARNRGLALATGDYVAFVDDDNVMHPGWLRAVAEYTGRNPGCDVLYGAQLREAEPDDIDPDAIGGTPELHVLYVAPYDHERMCTDNYVDLGALVVKRSHHELRFDESLDVFIDWEMIVRLATATPPHPLPVLASCYSTTATSRITTTADRPSRLAELRERFTAHRTTGP
jgi:hypothetical protein